MLIIPQVKIECDQRTLAEHSSGVETHYQPKPEDVGLEFFCDDFEVRVNGLPCPVRACRVSAMPFNRVWPGKQRDISQTEIASYVTFCSDGDVELEVLSKKKIEKAVLRPLSCCEQPKIEGDTLRFRLRKTGGYSLEINGVHNNLHIFFDPVREYPDAEKATYFFGPGLHCPGTITLKSNESVYIDREAIVVGGVFARNAKNIRVFGGGVLDNSCETRVLEHCYEDFTKGCARFYDCENVKIEDVILLNSSTWVLSCFYCKNVLIDNVKIVGHWRYNTDGIDLANTSEAVIRNTFIRSFDDTISIKGIYSYDGAIENITVDNCVLWCDWGHTAELGIETAAKEYKNIRFTNCDMIHNQCGAIAIRNGIYSDVHDILYSDLNVEIEKDRPVMIYQRTEDMVYDPESFTGDPMNQCAVMIDNKHYTRKMAGEPYPPISNVTLRNVNVLTDSDQVKPRFVFKSHDENVKFKNVVFKNVCLNSVKQTDFSGFNAELDNTEYTLR
ncbi:MAG: right-handed parallel beta-helix repeat-containing protein [Clostridia bacterium]|nr:right-handed parallel beta-helix repeat-containing protein [Clostridia bacterium]